MKTMNDLSTSDLALIYRVLNESINKGRGVLPTIHPDSPETLSRFIGQLTSLRNIRQKVRISYYLISGKVIQYYPTCS